tara:strand:+ start:224 stop:2149 length:1926 start_codon:yes stop_codon:yes gene_type:complete
MANFDTINATAGHGFTADIGGFMRVNDEARELRSAINESQAVIAERLQTIQTQILSPDQQTDTITSLQAQQGQLDTWAASLSETNLWANGNAQETIWGVQEAIRTELGSGDDTRNRYLQNLRNLVSIGHEHRAMSEREAAHAAAIDYLASQGYSQADIEAGMTVAENIGLVGEGASAAEQVLAAEATIAVKQDNPEQFAILERAGEAGAEQFFANQDQLREYITEYTANPAPESSSKLLYRIGEMQEREDFHSEELLQAFEDYRAGTIDYTELETQMWAAIAQSDQSAFTARQNAFDNIDPEVRERLTARFEDDSTKTSLLSNNLGGLNNITQYAIDEINQLNEGQQGWNPIETQEQLMAYAVEAQAALMHEDNPAELTLSQRIALEAAQYDMQSRAGMLVTSMADALPQIQRAHSQEIAATLQIDVSEVGLRETAEYLVNAIQSGEMSAQDIADIVMGSTGQEFTEDERNQWLQVAEYIANSPESADRLADYVVRYSQVEPGSAEMEELESEILNATIVNFEQEIQAQMQEQLNEATDRRMEELTAEMALEMDTAITAQQEAQAAEVDARMEQMFADMEAEQQAQMERRMQPPQAHPIPGVNPDEFVTLESADVTDSGELTPSNAPAQEQEQTRGAALSS